jgi:hypothetical protein
MHSSFYTAISKINKLNWIINYIYTSIYASVAFHNWLILYEYKVITTFALSIKPSYNSTT